MSNSWKDLWLVLLSFVEVSLLAFTTLAFGTVSSWFVFASGVVLVFLNCTNFQCIAHNFLHTPFFRSKALNQAYSLFNTLALGVPQTLYRSQHLHHHKYNNDAKDAAGTTQDQSSTYRCSRSPTSEESIITYALLGPFRTDVWRFSQDARKHQRGALLLVETLWFVLFATVLGVLNPRGLLWFFLPVWYFGQVAALAENYLEHHLAIPGNRLTDSVSSYGKLYNWVWFNNGYHQEHHFRPQVHWTQIRKLREQMLPESQRRVAPGAHWFNFSWNGQLPRSLGSSGSSTRAPAEAHSQSAQSTL